MIDLDLLDPSASLRGKKLPTPSPALVVAARTHGILDAVICRQSRSTQRHYEILRHLLTWRIAQEAQLQAVPAVVYELSDKEASDLVLADVESWGGTRPDKTDPITEAKLLRQEYVTGKGLYRRRISTLARKYHVTRALIWQKLMILELEEKVQQLGFEGKLTFGHLRALRGLGRSDQIRLAMETVRDHLSVRALFVRAHALKNSLSVPSHRDDSLHEQQNTPGGHPDIRRLEENLRGRLGCRVTLAKNTLMIDVGGNLQVLLGVLEKCADALEIPRCVTTFDSRALNIHFDNDQTVNTFLDALGIKLD